jgi:hypothetical protein
MRSWAIELIKQGDIYLPMALMLDRFPSSLLSVSS